MKQTTLARIWSGASAMLGGIKHVWKEKEVRRAYRFVLLALFVLALLLNAAGLYGVVHYTEPAQDAGRFWSLGLIVLRVIGVIFVLLFSPLAAISLGNILFPVFSEIPFFAGLRSLAQARSESLEQREGLGNAAAILHSLRRFVFLLFVVALCFAISLVPVVGAVVAAFLNFFLSARTLGWELLDPYFDKASVPWTDQKKVLKRFGPEILGMGLVCAPLLSIPLLGPLLFGLLQAGAANFIIVVFPEGDSTSALLGTSDILQRK